jgi:alpha-amylase
MLSNNSKIFLFVFFILFSGSDARTASEWKTRTVYQLLTDRFARTDNSNAPCPNLSNYCGGTFQGVAHKLSYIMDMGFDAIWISPIVTNTPGGYHGYWLQNLYTINSNFGTSNDLLAMVRQAQHKNVWVMVDVVANHVGPVEFDYRTIVPFNKEYHYHRCDPCPPGCSIQNWNDQPQVETCRLLMLPDLNQTVPEVANYLLTWIKQTVQYYGFDGIRIDTVPEVSKSFWSQFASSAGVFQMGEVYASDPKYVAGYQGPLTAVFSYPLYFTLLGIFAYKNSMRNLESMLVQYQQLFSDMSVLGTFIDNHDHPRFLNVQSDYTLYKNALTYVLTAIGIPFIYYGTEQGFSGGNDPANREPLWPSQYRNSSQIYAHIKLLVHWRKQVKIWEYSQIQRYADDNFYAFTRGPYFVALTNVGSNGPQIIRTITYHPYQDGTTLCNLFWPTDCIVVRNRRFQVYLNNGECKVFYPK